MNPEIKNNFEKLVEGNQVTIVGMEVHPSSLEEGEVGRDFNSSSLHPDFPGDAWIKSWDGRIGYKKDKKSKYAYIVAAPIYGTEDWVRFIQIPMSYRKFKKLLNHEPKLTDFRAQNESLNPMREFIAIHLEQELDANPYVRKP